LTNRARVVIVLGEGALRAPEREVDVLALANHPWVDPLEKRDVRARRDHIVVDH
jgi:hypothetical protein